MKPRLAIAKGNTGASAAPADPIDALYERHLNQVKRWARQLAGPAADLEDLVHDIFLVALRKGFQERGEASVDTWLFRIAHHEVRAKRRRSRLRQLLLGRHQDTLVPAAPNTPQQEMERRERHARLYQALDRLPDCYRTTLILYEIEELSGERVAELTETSLGTVWVRLHRGRERLVELLVREDDREDLA
jgi:RNA polymerase sigma-70 factor (ECF subfamily)